MLKRVRKGLKHGLCYLPDSNYLRLLSYYPKLRKWQNTRTDATTPRFDSREQLYDYIVANHTGKDLDFLEFGCHAGLSLRYWAQKYPGKTARFVGFDTFTGLPEKWQCIGWSVPAGIWDLGGEPPKSDDSRLSYVKGLFQDSLPPFVAASLPLDSRRPLIVHMDADLYSSTLYVLSFLSEYLPGSIVLFDEFDCAFDEYRALEDFCSAYQRDYDVLAVTNWCEHVAIRFAS